MLTFTYEARDPATGQKVKADIQAENEQTAAKLIHQQGLAPLTIVPKDAAGTGLGKFLHKVKAKDRVLFSRQLSTLINAGLPLVQSLRSVAEQTESKPLKVIINQVIGNVEAGSSFSVALKKHPEVFNSIYISMIGAGEISGTLDTALERLADQQEKDSEIVAKVRGAMIYPIIVIFVMVAVVTFMIVTVLPQVEELYRGLQGTSLPILTRVLLTISHLVTGLWWAVILLTIAGGFGFSRWIRLPGGRQAIDKFKMKAWPVGPLFMKMYMARFARTGSTLIASGVPLIQMLEITADAVNNVHVSGSIKTAIEKVRGGKALSVALENDSNFLELVPNMLKIGEQSGAIEKMLEKVADYYEKEVDTQIKNISTIIEPVLMVILGVVALVIVAAILLPIYSLVGKSIIK